MPVSFLLHLTPGSAILLLYVLVVPAARDLGFHAEFALYLSFLVVGIPLPLAYLYYRGKKRNGARSLRGIVLFRDKVPRDEYKRIAGFLLVFAFYLGAIAVVTSPITSLIEDSVLGDFPRWFLNPYSRREVQPADVAVLVTLIMRLVIDGIAHPIVEELYFRGYLLHRLSRFGAWSPVIGALFFAGFHVWQPQNMPVIFLSVLPWMYLIWRRRSVRLSMLVHCLGNSIGATIVLLEFISQG